ncbi:MAG: hypothetical protein AAFQ94_23045 [Bacteroidota bacterium]
MINLFEKYLSKGVLDSPLEKGQLFKDEEILNYTFIDEPPLKRKTYLKFSPNDLYTFGLINYLTTPYFHNITRHVRNYGDKLMVSTSYILDHLYKFHNEGFSWRNLEVTPEIIDVNKAPVLRKLIGEIVDFLAYSNLKIITSGLYDYKFNSRIAQEIDYLSKISEHESAAFNFTLDESQEIKKHYKRKLHLILKENPFASKNEMKNNTSNYFEFIHSIALIQQSLGDLYYYDQEYDDAITSYQNAIHMFRNNDGDPLPVDLMIIYTRIMLKLCQALEKKKSYHSALMGYSSLTQVILLSMDVNIVQLGLKKSKLYGSGLRYILKGDEKFKEHHYSYFGDFVDKKFAGTRFKLLQKTMTVENMRLMFQPFISKLYAIEKVKNGGVTWDDIETCLDEIAFVLNLASEETRKILEAEYYNKIGDLLFYKNISSKKLMEKSAIQKSKYFNKFDDSPSCSIFYKQVMLLCTGNSVESTPVKEYLHKTLKKAWFKTYYADCRFDQLKTLANNLSDLGDSLIPCSNIRFPLKHLWDKKLNSDLALSTDNDANSANCKAYLKNRDEISDKVKYLRDFSDLQDAIACFIYSHKAHVFNNDHKRASFQYLKILHLIVSKCELTELRKTNVKYIKSNLIRNILVSLYRSYSSSTRPELAKLMSIFKIEGDPSDQFAGYILNQLPPIGEVQEVIALFNYIRIYSAEAESIALHQLSPGYYPNISQMYSRAVQLSVKVRANNMIYLKLIGISGKNKKKEKNIKLESLDLDVKFADGENYFQRKGVTKKNAANYLIADSIYCLTELIRLLQNFGVTYTANNSFYGFAYEKRALWCTRFENFLKLYKQKSGTNIQPQLYNMVRTLVGAESLEKLRPYFNLENAVNYYTKCLELHNHKYVYDGVISSMHYMDDNFNDDYLHFYSALERSKLEKIRSKRDDISDELNKDSKLYNIDKYLISI